MAWMADTYITFAEPSKLSRSTRCRHRQALGTRMAPKAEKKRQWQGLVHVLEELLLEWVMTFLR